VKLKLEFNETQITASEAIADIKDMESDIKLKASSIGFDLWHKVKPGQPLGAENIGPNL